MRLTVERTSISDTTHAMPHRNQEGGGFVRALDCLMAHDCRGLMIGSCIFIVSADISRQTVPAGGLLLTWILTGALLDDFCPLSL